MKIIIQSERFNRDDEVTECSSISDCIDLYVANHLKNYEGTEEQLREELCYCVDVVEASPEEMEEL
jgi:hypothetical protein